MLKFNLDFIVQSTSGILKSRVAEQFSGFGTDTRTSLADQFFIALKGENFDAHDFIQQAVKSGASGVLVHEWRQEYDQYCKQVSFVLVQDTLLALQSLANAYRKTLTSKIVGITGSNGKTTTKEFAAAVLAISKKVHFNKGSFNNHWGVPLTLLQIPTDCEVALIEMGMNHAGEITQLVRIAEPDVVVCSMVGRAHIEHFGTIEGIAKAKEEIYEASHERCVRLYNLDNTFTRGMFEKALKNFPKARVISFSTQEPKADISFKIEELSMQSLKLSGRISGHQGQVEVPVFGSQNVTNLLAAAAIGLAVDMAPADIWKGLASCKTNWGRNQFVDLKIGAKMIFDAYNANPDSMKALIDNVRLIKTKGKKIAVLGEMLEMGEQAPQLHRELGEIVGRSGMDTIFFIGPHASDFEAGVRNQSLTAKIHTQYDFDEKMANLLVQEIKQEDVILVKGSRGMKLERFVIPCQPLNFSLDKGGK